MNVNTIVTNWLKEHGYDGLLNGNGECGCERTDLCPCESSCLDCEPGYKVKSHDPDYKWVITTKLEPEDERLPVTE